MSMKENAPDQPFRLEGVEKELREIPLRSIVVRSDDYSFRSEEDLSEERLTDLIESLKTHRGPHTPVLVLDMGDGSYLLLDGHGRVLSLRCLVRDGIADFTNDMMVPAVVIVSQVNERDRLAILASSNIARRSLDAEGRQRLAFRMHQEGMAKDQIAKLLGVSLSTIDRDVLLGSDPEMMGHVRLNHIGATAAAKLVKLSRDNQRYDEFMQTFESWVDQVQERLEDEVARAAEQDESSLYPVERWPGRQLSREQFASWVESLEKGLSFGEATFRYRAALKDDRGRKRVVVDPLDKALDGMTAEEVAKVYRRFVDLGAALEPVLVEKAEAEREAAQAAHPSEAEAPGLRRLRELNLASLLEESDEPSEAPEDWGDHDAPDNGPD